MKAIEIKSMNGKKIFEVRAYKAGERVTIFKGTTGTFGKDSGSKTSGIICVTKGPTGIIAEDMEVDNSDFWDWVKEWMQKGMDAGRSK